MECGMESHSNGFKGNTVVFFPGPFSTQTWWWELSVYTLETGPKAPHFYTNFHEIEANFQCVDIFRGFFEGWWCVFDSKIWKNNLDPIFVRPRYHGPWPSGWRNPKPSPAGLGPNPFWARNCQSRGPVLGGPKTAQVILKYCWCFRNPAM